ncbi:MAG: hypothetical protein WCC41_18060 [Rhodomicrobium sp.]
MALVVDISSHGYGHLMQIAPVVRALRHLRPHLRVVARCDLPREIVAEALGPAVDHAPGPPDIGMVMAAPHLVDREATWQAYSELFTDLDRVTKTEAAALEAIGAKAVLTDIAFMGIRAASTMGLPTVALSSLHWGEMVRQYIGNRPNGAAIASLIEEIYDEAKAFLLAAPRQDIAGISKIERIPPLVRHWGRSAKAEILRSLGLSEHFKIGLVAFGGIPLASTAVTIPNRNDWIWITAHSALAQSPGRSDIIDARRLAPLSVLDLLASSDLVLTKTGYGTFVESAYYRVPCLFLKREDWPENKDFEAWMVGNGYGAPITTAALSDGSWMEMADSWSCRPAPLRELGHETAASRILQLLEL